MTIIEQLYASPSHISKITKTCFSVSTCQRMSLTKCPTLLTPSLTHTQRYSRSDNHHTTRDDTRQQDSWYIWKCTENDDAGIRASTSSGAASKSSTCTVSSIQFSLWWMTFSYSRRRSNVCVHTCIMRCSSSLVPAHQHFGRRRLADKVSDGAAEDGVSVLPDVVCQIGAGGGLVPHCPSVREPPSGLWAALQVNGADAGQCVQTGVGGQDRRSRQDLWWGV